MICSEMPCERNSFLISGTFESFATNNTLTSGWTCWNFTKPPSSETHGPYQVDQISNTTFLPRSEEAVIFSPVALRFSFIQCASRSFEKIFGSRPLLQLQECPATPEIQGGSIFIRIVVQNCDES